MSEPLIDVTGARRRRARARLKRRLVAAGVIVGVLALVGGTLWVVHASPWLATSQVRVEGNSLATSEDIMAAAAVPLGAPLAQLDQAAIEARVAAQVPAVATVDAARAWPSTVVITVTERTPRLVLEVPGAWVWVSGDAVPFHTTPERPPGVVQALGDLADPEVLTTLATVAADLPPEVHDVADHISAWSVDSVTITLTDRRRIVWGSAEDAALKSSVLVPLMGVDAVEYDVSAPNHPTTR